MSLLSITENFIILKILIGLISICPPWAPLHYCHPQEPVKGIFPPRTCPLGQPTLFLAFHLGQWLSAFLMIQSLMWW